MNVFEIIKYLVWDAPREKGAQSQTITNIDGGKFDRPGFMHIERPIIIMEPPKPKA